MAEVSILYTTRQLVLTLPMLGVFMTCMEMFGIGASTGTLA